MSVCGTNLFCKAEFCGARKYVLVSFWDLYLILIYESIKLFFFFFKFLNKNVNMLSCSFAIPLLVCMRHIAIAE